MVEPEERRQRRMVFLIKRQVTAAIGRPGRLWRGGRRPAAKVNDFDGGCKEDPTSPRSKGSAEVDVLCIHGVAFVEETDGLCILAAHEKTRAADPVGRARL